jgi:hypothetical protein
MLVLDYNCHVHLQVGSDVYLCYKKAMVKADVLVYKPSKYQFSLF